MPVIRFNSEIFAQGTAFLCQADPDLQRVHAEFGAPPLWHFYLSKGQ